MGPVALVVAGVLGAAGGQLSGRLADAVAAPRYGPGTDGFDPEDAELAPLQPPTTARQRAWLSALGAAGLVAIAASIDDGWTVAYFGVLLLGYLSAMTVDLQYLRLPNVFTYPAALFAVAGAWGLSQHLDQPFAGAVAGLVTYAGFLWLARIAYQLVRGREGMGLGDVKLALSLGASAGWLGGLFVDPAAIGAIQLVIYAVLLGNLIGAFGGVLLVRQFEREFPFGPALVAGWLIVVVLADTLVG